MQGLLNTFLLQLKVELLSLILKCTIQNFIFNFSDSFLIGNIITSLFTL